ncbi:MAG: PIN domain-containing protein [Candidatus Sulfotelmatobacter sp.]
MTHAVLADSGPLFAIADEGDAHHDRALRDLSKLSRERREVLVAYPILLETYSLVLFRLGRRVALQWLSQIVSAAFVNPIPEDHRQAVVRVQVLSDQSITLVDATVAAIASRLALQVWTYDHDFDVMRVPVWR